MSSQSSHRLCSALPTLQFGLRIKVLGPKGHSTLGRYYEVPDGKPADVKSWLTGKDPDAGKDWGQEERGTTEVRWLDGITDSMDMFEQTPGDSEGQRSLVLPVIYCSFTQLCPTLCNPMDCSTPGFPVSQSLLKFMSIESVIPSNISSFVSKSWTRLSDWTTTQRKPLSLRFSLSLQMPIAPKLALSLFKLIFHWGWKDLQITSNVGEVKMSWSVRAILGCFSPVHIVLY